MKLRGTPKALIMIACVFALPLLLAQLFLSQGWYEKGYTNKGKFISEHLTYEGLSMRNPLTGLWQVGYVLPEDCQDFCLTQLALMRNSWLALGRKQERVSLVVFTHSKSDLIIKQKINHSDIYIWTEAPQKFYEKFEDKQLVIIDPLGKFVLSYAGKVERTRKEQIMENRDLMLDLRKLLTFSKAG